MGKKPDYFTTLESKLLLVQSSWALEMEALLKKMAPDRTLGSTRPGIVFALRTNYESHLIQSIDKIFSVIRSHLQARKNKMPSIDSVLPEIRKIVADYVDRWMEYPLRHFSYFGSQMSIPPEAMREAIDFLRNCAAVKTQAEMDDLSTSLKEAEKPSTNKDSKITPFSTPPSTQWQDIAIKFINDEKVTIKVKGTKGKAVKCDYKRMGLVNRNKPDTQWELLLSFAYFSEIGRVHDAKRRGLTQEEKNALADGLRLDGWEGNDSGRIKTRKHRLQNALKAFFPQLEGDPFFYDPVKNAWVPRFEISYPASRVND